MLNSLACQLVSEAQPAGIQYGFRHAGFGEPGGIDIADCDVVKLAHDARRKLVAEIVSAIGDLRTDCLDAPLLVGALGNRQRLLRAAIDAPRFNLFARGQGSEVLQAKVNPQLAVLSLRLLTAGPRGAISHPGFPAAGSMQIWIKL